MSLPMPFPLASGRYEVGPSMRRFGVAGQGFPAEEGHFQPDALLAHTIRAKLGALRQAPAECHLLAPHLSGTEEAGLRSALQATFRLLAREHPEMATVDNAGVTLHHLGLRVTDWWAPRVEVVAEARDDLVTVATEVHAWLAEREGLWLLGDALGLAVQEDLALTRGPHPAEASSPAPGETNPAPGADLLEWLHVCLPSNWAPSAKVGRSFGEVHQPVVHSERLVSSQAQLVRAMIHAGPFVRYVWGIHRDAALCHNPRIHQAAPWREGAAPHELAHQAYFRVERQTTHGFPQLNRALFTIRYWVEPLTVTASDPWRRERLATALAAMDPEELAYKGLTTVRDALVTYLQQ